MKCMGYIDNVIMKIRHIYFKPKNLPGNVYTPMAFKRAHTLHVKGGNELHGIRTRMFRKCKMTLKMQPSAITDPP